MRLVLAAVFVLLGAASGRAADTPFGETEL